MRHDEKWILNLSDLFAHAQEGVPYSNLLFYYYKHHRRKRKPTAESFMERWVAYLDILVCYKNTFHQLVWVSYIIRKMVNCKHCNFFFLLCHKHETQVPILMWNIMAHLWIPCSSELQRIAYISVALWQWIQRTLIPLSTELMRTVICHR